MNKSRIIPQAVILTGFVALIIIAFYLMGKGQPGLASTTVDKATNIPNPAKPLSQDDEMRIKNIEKIKTKIADPNLPSDTRKIFQKRLEVAEFEATFSAQPTNAHPTIVVETIDPTKMHGKEVEDGIVVDIPIPFPSQSVIINTVWKGRNGNDQYLVYSGSITDHSDEGLVIVRRLGKKEEKYVDHDTFYETPVKAGSVKITGYDGLILQLTAENGDTFSFNVINGLFIGYPAPTPAPEQPNPQATAYP